MELNAASVATANKSAYTPRGLPRVFYAGAAGSGSVVGAGALPSAPYLPDERRERLDYRPLPDAEVNAYRIGVGDVLLLATPGAGSTVEQLTGLLAAQTQRQGYTVRDDGAIAIPEIGTIELAGLTIEESEDKLFQVLVQNQIEPSFSLEVAEFNSQRVVIGGAVKKALIVPITLNPLTLGEALATAGGLATKDEEFASIRIYREGKLYQIPVEMYLERADLHKKLLTSGDAVYVDTTYDLDRAFSFYEQKLNVFSLRSKARSDALQALVTEITLQRAALTEQRSNFLARVELDAESRDYVYLTGEVEQQGRIVMPYARQTTLADVLYGGGGFDTTTGNPSQIYVLRAPLGAAADNRIVAYHLDAGNAANIVLATRMEMRPSDVVFIEEQPITKWGRAMQQLFPVLVQTVQASL
ncbi:MAG: sugar transporter [Rhodobacteraceae bacterium]|nr:sugar transporter [Paracoccaceae bacterium]